MSLNPAIFLVLITIGGVAVIGGVLLVRLRDQRAQDVRVVVSLRFPRELRQEQVLAVVRSIIGLAPAKTGLVGRDSVVLEVVGTRAAITHRLRLPQESSAYLIQRAAVPGGRHR